MWKSSIPENWFKLADPSRFYNMRVEKKNKSTLQFLEETQKYIYNIRKPLANSKKSRQTKSAQSIDMTKSALREVKTAVPTNRGHIESRMLTSADGKSSFLTSRRQDLFPRVTSFDSLKSL